MTTADRPIEVPDIQNANLLHVDIITAEWNSEITHRLRDSAVQTLLGAGVPCDNIRHFDVPGTIELTYAARGAMESARKPDALIVIGTVIRGDTPHFDYVCQSVTQGVTLLNAEGKAPVIFCVLTVENRQQALDRCGGAAGDKGAEAAIAALKMSQLKF